MRRLVTLVVLFAVASLATAARADTVKVLTAGAFKQVVMALVPAFETRSGHTLQVDTDTAGGIARRIAAGEAYDVIVQTPAGLRQLADGGKVAGESIVPLARVGIGVAVKAGSPLPAIGTVDEFKQAVLDARKVAYIDPAAGGTSGIYLDGLFQRLGIADAVRAKAVLVPGGFSAERITRGEADLAIQQISELLPVPGVTVVGPLPDAIQNYTTYAGALSVGASQSPAARSFLATLAGPDAADTIRAKGMQPPK
jgi:molybdate transport system substrate-binding protein